MFTKFVKGNFPNKHEFNEIKHHVKNQLANFVIDERDDVPMLGVGGTIRSVGKLNNDFFESEDGERFVTIKNIKKMKHYLSGGTTESILKLVQLVPERTHTILPGMTVLKTIAKHYNCTHLTVSNYGVREGYLISKLRGGDSCDEK